MDTLSQLDISSPDHVSVITRDGRVTVSVTKDGSSCTLAFPVKTPVQPHQLTLIKTETSNRRTFAPTGTTHVRYVGATPKLTVSQVKEIKMMLADPDIIRKFKSMTEAHKEIGRAYNVTGCAIGNIARGIAWKHVKI